jgi:carboxyl-terminal processing protease
MFDRTLDVLSRHYFDTAFRRTTLKTLNEEFRPAALAATSAAEERDVIWQLLTRVPGSHLTLLSRRAYQALMGDVAGGTHVMLGMQLVSLDGRYFATSVLDGGPAATAGVQAWDEVVLIDSVPPAGSSHVDPRSDDASLPDPPMHTMNAPFGDTVQLRLVRVPGETLTVRVAPKPYSTLQATQASVRLMSRGGVRVGYIHWWFMNSRGVPAGFEAALNDPLATSEALLLDLRGRGGSDPAVRGLLTLISPGPEQRFRGPIVALIDKRTRSAKEQLAYELRERGLAVLVGEPTAGAYHSSGFATVGNNLILMFPQRTKFGFYTERIEGRPVMPHVPVASAGPYARGADPLIDAGLAEVVRLVAELGPGRTLPGKATK